ncbi:MAG: hypothetical protein LBQ50_00200 [Planctomycetaceae bacterium]|jgi:hypothetical protein|nr:hypothetical protein [Planctomycetaceae bacterium]
MTLINRTECHCPVCGAVQTWRDECRRCRTDLGVLRLLNEEIRLLNRKLVCALKDGDFRLAERVAQKLEQIDPNPLNETVLKFCSSQVTG